MSRFPNAPDEGSSAPKQLRNLALRAHRVLNEPAHEGPTGVGPTEIQSLLRQIDQLQRHFDSPQPTDLHRWLARVRQMVEDRGRSLKLRSRRSAHAVR